MDCYANLAKNLKELRKLSQKTQQQVADEVNIPRSSIGRYETGGAVPPLDVLLILADYYDITVDDLLRN